MKTLFANNENFVSSVFEVLSFDELNQVKGGGDGDLYWDDNTTFPKKK